MADYPFVALLMEVLGANSTGTLSFSTPANEEYTILGFRKRSSGAFRVTSIRDSRGIQYANFDANEYATGDIFADTTTETDGISDLPVPITLPGATTLYVDVRDDSGAGNTVRIYAICKRKTG